MGDELFNEFKEEAERLLRDSRENEVYNSTLECLDSIKYDITWCRDEDFKPNNKIDKRCCHDYRDKCRLVLEPIIEKVFGENYKVV